MNEDVIPKKTLKQFAKQDKLINIRGSAYYDFMDFVDKALPDDEQNTLNPEDKEGDQDLDSHTDEEDRENLSEDKNKIKQIDNIPENT